MKRLKYIEQDYSNNGLTDDQNSIIDMSYREALCELNEGGSVELLEALIEYGAEGGFYENCAGIKRAIEQYYEDKNR